MNQLDVGLDFHTVQEHAFLELELDVLQVIHHGHATDDHNAFMLAQILQEIVAYRLNPVAL